MSIVSAAQWEDYLSAYPDVHLLQTRTWGDLKAAFGWKVVRLCTEHCGTQILFRKILPGSSLAYIPKGPIGIEQSDLWHEIDRVCRQRHAIFIKIEPDCWEWRENSRYSTEQISPPPGFSSSPHSIQPPRTLVIDLDKDEKNILGQMKQKTRYNINLALKKGVVVRPSSDIRLFHSLMQVTGQRDQFGVHSQAYYQRAYDLFHPRGACELLVAEYEKEPLAALMVFMHGSRAWYFYGASSNLHRDRMPNYLLQWEAMRWARLQGCKEYDLWGVPDVDLNSLESEFTEHHEGLWGVYRFKRGFGGELRRAAGPYDRILNPPLYSLYRLWLKVRRAED
jgi:peptidoglycan pentaglycine glycine transferase (the first glycine)